MISHIQAAVLHEPGDTLSIEQLELAPLRNDEVLVKLAGTGICHTDLTTMRRPFPTAQSIVLGHEGAGIVAAVGSHVSRLAPGDAVVMSYNACGRCRNCVRQASMYCRNFFGSNFLGQREDGTTALSQSGVPVRNNFFGQSSFASHSVCREFNAVKVETKTPLAMLGPLGCGIQTGAGAIINVLKPAFGQSLAIFGAGSVGLAALLAAKAIGVGTLIAVDIDATRLKLALELGATHVIDPRKDDPVAAIHAITDDGVDFSFETTGNPVVMRAAVESLRALGQCGLVGGTPPGTEFTLDVRDTMTQGKTIRGIVEGDANSHAFIPELIKMHEQGRFAYDKLIRFYPFEQINQAIADSASGVAVKAIVRFDR
ncbi:MULTISPECIES: NAD(P)-dependent alcohol dehydrogenase [Variovorax]|jgi:aryl-alcohol dehydrogenase|uniref:NAD(P)-dependent alcohol dehydrogenase n=1 Tax=Variovorax TaxID=34072 RepID=UPI00086A25C6|nr:MULTISPECIES: NAD(P)-dependent alcohol dehydrogenase [Variovorax]ODS94711.1 MAG: hypothetical protein ABS56_17445 [Lautropia sp. SCN 69-89]MBN8751798.1 NAD(P)-dependent alcohol dehydrogenase [Variovorax sp.]ODV15386.1 MAG: hypothetical protein ABT25_32625 [Variovorax sp. SCN 67-20]OJZ12722.1 MAG: NAD(P)-dependent alcohol dehydrogenase [Variovorax sp. 67-131]UKI07780.1 NAD(P)-dependent alcohol dehydrogenase [Variovorax paradoxus]